LIQEVHELIDLGKGGVRSWTLALSLTAEMHFGRASAGRYVWKNLWAHIGQGVRLVARIESVVQRIRRQWSEHRQSSSEYDDVTVKPLSFRAAAKDLALRQRVSVDIVPVDPLLSAWDDRGSRHGEALEL